MAGQSAIQVNNVSSAAGMATDVPDAYAIVSADGFHELFAYALVVDNESRDGIFVAGESLAPLK